MSFNYNPYRHIELVQPSPNEPGWVWHCHSCGADGKKPKLLVQAHELVAEFFWHIRVSHKRTPDDFEGWSAW